MKLTEKHDQFARCHCGHTAGHHAVDAPWPCRLNCECEGFITQAELDRLNALMDEK